MPLKRRTPVANAPFDSPTGLLVPLRLKGANPVDQSRPTKSPNRTLRFTTPALRPGAPIWTRAPLTLPSLSYEQVETEL